MAAPSPFETVSSTELQRSPGKTLRRRTPVVVTSSGAPMQLCIPVPKDAKKAQALLAYLENCLEDWEMQQNAPALAKKWQQSANSGWSDLKI